MEKTMRSVVVLLMLVLSFLSCSREPSAKAEQAEADKRERERKNRERYLAESRDRDLAAAKKAVAEFRGPEGADWTAVVKGGLSGPAADLCSQVERLLDLQHVFDRVDTPERYDKDPSPISWEEVGVSRPELWKEFHAASKKAAAALFAVYKRANVERNIGCGSGEGSWRLDDPGMVGQRLVWVMEGAKITPSNLGTTAEAMRATLVADYRAYIARYRGMIARGEASKSDGGGAIAAAVRDAEQLWKIPRVQLGLTAEEQQLAER